MLIRRQLDAAMSEVSSKMMDLTRIVEDTRRLSDIESKVDDVEINTKNSLTKLRTEIVALTTKLQI